MTLNSNDLTSVFIEFNLGFFKKPPPWAPSSPPRHFSLSLSNIPNVQPEVQIFSATALERQPSGGIAGNVTIWAPVRKRLQIRSLQLLWGTLCAFFHDLRACEEKTFHRWTHMNLSGHVYFPHPASSWWWGSDSTRTLSGTLLIFFNRFVGDLMICFAFLQ